MPGCHDMKKDEVYVCSECGLEIKVKKECKDAKGAETCCIGEECCDIMCCGQPLVKK